MCVYVCRVSYWILTSTCIHIWPRDNKRKARVLIDDVEKISIFVIRRKGSFKMIFNLTNSCVAWMR